MSSLKKVAVLGAGVIGAGWIARFAENGVAVGLYDPAEDTREKVEAVLANAERAYSKLTMAPRPGMGAITYAASLAEAVAGAELVIEAVPEVLKLKQRVYAEVEADYWSLIPLTLSICYRWWNWLVASKHLQQ